MIKTIVLHVAKALGLFSLSRFLTRRCLRILCYHGVWLGPPPHYGDCLFIDADTFARRMRALERAGYHVIPLAEACGRFARGTLSSRDVAITIDDGWQGTFRHMLPVLERNGFPATLYIATEPILRAEPLVHLLTAYLVERSSTPPEAYEALFPELSLTTQDRARLAQALAGQISGQPTPVARIAEIERIADKLGLDGHELIERAAFHLMTPEEVSIAQGRGIDVQLHTHTHRMHDFAPEQVAEELDLNRTHLSALTGRPADQLIHFCYPSGRYHASLFPLLREKGIVSATTTEFGLNPPGSNPLALKRILDGESISDIEFEARLSGFWSFLKGIKALIRPHAEPQAAPQNH